MAVAPPFVAFSSFTEAVVPGIDWPAVYSSLQALKAHTQEYPGCQRFDVFTRAELEGEVGIHCYTTWDTQAQLEAYLERGYTLERMLADVGEALEAERTLVMEKLF
jgi:quinol monooxygenase YgiN